MQSDDRLNDIRRRTLDRADRADRTTTGWLIFTAIWEGVFLITFLLLLDFHDRLHQLLLVMALLIYGTLAFALITLAVYARSWMRRILKAIELLDEHDPAKTGL